MSRLLASLVLCAALLLPGQGWAALLIDTRTSSTILTTTPAVLSFTVNESSPMFALVWGQFSQTVNGCTYNGTAMTELGAFSNSGVMKGKLYAMKNPATGTHDISCDISANPDGLVIIPIATTGGDTTTGYRTLYTRSDVNGTGPGLTVADSQNGDQVLHMCSVYAATVTWDGSEVTTSTTFNNLGSNGLSGGLSTLAATAANTGVGCTDATTYNEYGIAIIPASGGAPDMTHIYKRRIQ